VEVLICVDVTCIVTWKNHQEKKNEIWKVDLRSRKTGCSIETIFSGEHDAACDYIQEWYENNDIPGYVDGMSFEELHDGSEGVFTDLYLADIPYGIGKEIDIKDMKKVCDFDL
jgi:hypothetical protein